MAMPLMNSTYPVGSCREFIETIPDEDVRAIAWGEYYYFSGQAELATQMMGRPTTRRQHSTRIRMPRMPRATYNSLMRVAWSTMVRKFTT